MVEALLFLSCGGDGGSRWCTSAHDRQCMRGLVVAPGTRAAAHDSAHNAAGLSAAAGGDLAAAACRACMRENSGGMRRLGQGPILLVLSVQFIALKLS